MNIKTRIKLRTWAVRFAGWLQSGSFKTNKPKTELLKGEILTKYFAKKYLPNIESIEQKEITVESPETLWQFWSNPIERETPEIVKSCLASAEKFKGNFEHTILNNTTFENYSDLPDFVMEKFRNGHINYAHFADLLRLNLLKNHGGMWLDATGYMTDFVPRQIINEDFFVFLTGEKTGFPYSYMQNCFIRAKKGSALCTMWYELCLEFWKKETKYLDYFQHQLLFKALVSNNSTAKELFIKMPHLSEDGIQGLVGKNLFQKFNIQEWEQIKKASFFQKTSYKKPNNEIAQLADFPNTYFSKICEGGLDNE